MGKVLSFKVMNMCATSCRPMQSFSVTFRFCHFSGLDSIYGHLMDLSRLPNVRLIKYRSKIKNFILPDGYSRYIWSPSTCLYPNDCFYFTPSRKPSPLPEFVFKSRFSYHRFKHGRPSFRHPGSDDSMFSASTIIYIPPFVHRSPRFIHHSTPLDRVQEYVDGLVTPSPSHSIGDLADELNLLNLSEESDGTVEDVQPKRSVRMRPVISSSDSESPLSRRISDRHSNFSNRETDESESPVIPKSRKIVEYDPTDADLALESPLSRRSSSSPSSSSRHFGTFQVSIQRTFSRVSCSF